MTRLLKEGLEAASLVVRCPARRPGSGWPDGGSGAVGDDLGQAVAEVRGVKRTEDGIAAELAGVVGEAL